MDLSNCLQLTKKVDHESVAIAINVGGWVRLELYGDICSGGVEFKPWLRPCVLAQNFGCKVISIIKGDKVVLPNVQPKNQKAQEGNYHLYFSRNISCGYLFFNQLKKECTYSACSQFSLLKSLAVNEEVTGSRSSTTSTFTCACIDNALTHDRSLKILNGRPHTASCIFKMTVIVHEGPKGRQVKPRQPIPQGGDLHHS